MKTAALYARCWRLWGASSGAVPRGLLKEAGGSSPKNNMEWGPNKAPFHVEGIFNQAIGTAPQILQHLGEKLLQPGVLGMGEEGLGLVLLGDIASSIKSTRVATERAKPISWVTTTMVMPSSASSFIISSTSPTISGSRAEVGSSKSITSGFMAKARAMAMRCCWPPESCLG